MQNTTFNRTVALTGTIANLLNPPELDGTTGVGITLANTFLMVKSIKVVNTTAGPLPVSLFKGATAAEAAGTELGASAKPVPANDSIDINFPPTGERFDVGDFLTGKSTGTGLTVNIIGEIGVCP